MIVALVALGVWVFPSRSVQAQTVLKSVRFSEGTFQRGFTFSETHQEFRLTVKPQTFSGPVTLTIEQLDAEGLPEWKDRIRESEVYRVTVSQDSSATLAQPIGLEFLIPPNGFLTAIGKLNLESLSWEELGSTLNTNGTRVRAADDQLTFTVAAFQHATIQQGLASYYGTYVRTTKLSLVAASNHFEPGQRVKVTNLENGKSVLVKIVDTGGFRYPRVIDLSTPAFAKIQPTWKGLARVRVEKATSEDSKHPETPESGDLQPAGPPVSSGATPPTTAATASIVVDVASGEKLVGKKTDLPLPIASLTKVMTAAVFMDTKPDLNRVVAYTSEDAAICSCLRLADGEQVSLKDLLFASLVGSANNATLSLVRATGLTRPEFVNRMNEKTQELGLKNTYFTDPTGLDHGNVSTVEDLAVMGRLLPDAYPSIKRVMGVGAYNFTSKNSLCLPAFKQKNGTCAHSFQTTNKLFGQTTYDIVSAKTGFIDEARHTFLLRAKNKGGHEVVLVFLKVDRKAESFSHANSLMNWVFENYTWS